MDYKFFREVAGKPSAECEDEASTFGDWLTNELGDNTEAVVALLAVIDQLQSGELKTHKLKGHDHTLILDEDEAELHSHLGHWDEDDALPEGTELDQQDAMGCGLEDLKELLIAWAEFIEK
jgi:uncharacterized protein YacL (UPF0231 family)